MSAPIHHTDPGRQPERTSLSWLRSILALLVCALTLLRWVGRYPAVLVAIAVVLTGVAAAYALTQGRRYARTDLAMARESGRPASAPILALSAALALAAGTEAVVIVVSLIGMP